MIEMSIVLFDVKVSQENSAYSDSISLIFQRRNFVK